MLVLMLMLVLVCVQVENILRPLDLSDDDYRKVMQLMLENMERGLSKQTNDTATIKMFPTYVRAVPDGTGKPPTPPPHKSIAEHVFVAAKHVFCRDESMRLKYVCRGKSFVVASVLLSQQKSCFVMANTRLSRQNLWQQKWYCGSSRQ